MLSVPAGVADASGFVTWRELTSVAPLYVALMSALPAFIAGTANVAVALPSGISTFWGRPDAPLSAMLAPPRGAGPFSLTVAIEKPPTVTREGDSVTSFTSVPPKKPALTCAVSRPEEPPASAVGAVGGA